MTSQAKKLIGAILIFLVLVLAGYYIWKTKIGTINIPEKEDQQEFPEESPVGEVSTLPGFSLPPGFVLNIFAKDVPGARAIELDPKGRILVSQTEAGKIVALSDTNADQVSDGKKVLASGLRKPHGMAFDCSSDIEDGSGNNCFLYVAEQNALTRFAYDADTPALGKGEKLLTLSSSLTDRHFTRSLVFLPFPDHDTLLISVGSSCDVCHEDNTDYASIISYNIKTGKKETYAKGLRNAVFMTLDPVSGRVFATEMGRDNLGDNLPPDEINIIEGPSTSSGQSSIPNFGWPNCYGKNIHDDVFDKNTYIRNPCMSPFETPSFVDLPAHSAPLGLAFIPEEGWAEEYWYNLLVAYHGSWNRTVPTGYKIVRLKMNAKGEYLGTEDFISGWYTQDGKKTGRPVDIKVFSGGVAYISDDDRGVIYRLTANPR